MPARNPADFRERAVAAGVPRPEAVRAYRVAPRTLGRWLARACRVGLGRPPALRPAGQARPGAPPVARGAGPGARTPRSPTASPPAPGPPQSVARRPPAGQARPAAQEKTPIARERGEAVRAGRRAGIAAVDPAGLVFVDETATPTTPTPLRARGPRPGGDRGGRRPARLPADLLAGRPPDRARVRQVHAAPAAPPGPHVRRGRGGRGGRGRGPGRRHPGRRPRLRPRGGLPSLTCAPCAKDGAPPRQRGAAV